MSTEIQTIIKRLIVLAWLMISCKSETISRSPLPQQQAPPQTNLPATATTSSKWRVAVIDDGFDITIPSLRQRMIASASIVCQDEQGASIDNSIDFQQLKQKMIADIDQAGTCTVREGVSLQKSPGFTAIAPFKQTWNSAVKNHFRSLESNQSSGGLQLHHMKQIDQVLSGEANYSYHGTNTAALVAYNNPNVELVLINIELSSGGEAIPCRSQALIDLYTRVFRDPEFRQKFIQAPVDPIIRQVKDLFKKYAIDLVNASFGEYSTRKLESIMREQGCPVKLSNYNIAKRSLQAERDAWVEQQLPSTELWFVSAGNDGDVINSEADGDICKNPRSIIVGAINAQGQRASFSNSGSCVDIYTLGEDVVTTAPDDFLFVTSGTSFASPLALRAVTTTQAKTSELSSILQSYKRSGKLITAPMIPTEIAALHPSPVSQFALTSQKVTPLPAKRKRFP